MRSLTTAVRPIVPRSLRRGARDLLNRFGIWWDRATGRSEPGQPPEELIQGTGGAWWVGDNYLRHFRELCGLRADETVLDVGCGVGRMAVPLTEYLGPAGRYEGFDIVPANVRWCRRAITPRWPNFRFRHADIFNREYNPLGRVREHQYRFPYADHTFDFAFLTSVFTHLMPPGTAHYLVELGRVLKPGGRCLATFNLLTDESDALIEAGKCKHVMQPRDGVIRVHSREVPEACVAIDEGFVAEAAEKAGLTIDRPIRYGSWCGREPAFEFQDVVIFRKPA
ncbi:MAG: Methyltransferase [Gemmataceae bacterium]|nr:Methyltransferase [Gemmataceae bacterium]